MSCEAGTFPPPEPAKTKSQCLSPWTSAPLSASASKPHALVPALRCLNNFVRAGSSTLARFPGVHLPGSPRATITAVLHIRRLLEQAGVPGCRRLSRLRQGSGAQWLHRAVHPYAEGEPGLGADPQHRLQPCLALSGLRDAYNTVWVVQGLRYRTLAIARHALFSRAALDAETHSWCLTSRSRRTDLSQALWRPL